MRLSRRKFLHAAAGAAVCSGFAHVASASDYPTRPVHLIIGYPPGGSADLTARLTGQWLSDRLGQQFIVESRPGAATNIATESVLRAAPDGYTLLLAAPANATNVALSAQLNFDFMRDITPVAGIIRFPDVVDVNLSVPVHTIPELISYAKANPGKLKWGSQGFGTAPHLLAEMFRLDAGLNVIHVPYRGTGPLLNAILAGEVQIIADPSTTSLPYIQDNKLRPIAIAGNVRDPKLPNVPTVVEAGFPKLQAPFWLAVVAPAGTPRDIVAKLNNAFRQALNAPETRTRLDALGAEVKIGTPEDLDKMLASERGQWTAVVKAANIKVE